MRTRLTGELWGSSAKQQRIHGQKYSPACVVREPTSRYPTDQLPLFEQDKEMAPSEKKRYGAFFTPPTVVQSLLKWALRSDNDRLIDPSCGDGRFIAGHRNSVGIEQSSAAARRAAERAPWAVVHESDFFSWARTTVDRFDCAAGNPPFIRYQTFKGELRDSALRLCANAGAKFNGLASSWAPFLVATATLLKKSGRMAFVVPAEIGHAPYAAPLIEYLAAHFSVVHIIAIRKKLFSDLSEDCWLLYSDNFGGTTDEIRFTALDSFYHMAEPPKAYTRVSLNEWRSSWGKRLRPFLMSAEARDTYREAVAHKSTRRFGELANIGIGYVSGANDFFHLRPAEANRLGIPPALLHPTVRNGRALPTKRLTASTVGKWTKDNEQILLLRLPKSGRIPASVSRYLDSEQGQIAREAYKCRVRDPWYSVPDVQIPDFFLSYMSGRNASLVRNDAGCTCTNSVHSVKIREGISSTHLQRTWESAFVKLSCEVEGHPLGGGMLKLEPREASSVALPDPSVLSKLKARVIDEALLTMRNWRHYADA